MSISKQCYNAEPSAYYFYVKRKILVDFHICISVPLLIFKATLITIEIFLMIGTLLGQCIQEWNK